MRNVYNSVVKLDKFNEFSKENYLQTNVENLHMNIRSIYYWGVVFNLLNIDTVDNMFMSDYYYKDSLTKAQDALRNITRENALEVCNNAIAETNDDPTCLEYYVDVLLNKICPMFLGDNVIAVVANTSIDKLTNNHNSPYIITTGYLETYLEKLGC